MKAFSFTAILLFLAASVFAQTDSTTGVFDFVEQMPEFPGGNTAMMSFIGKNITYPEYERINNIEGKVLLKFVVDVDGSVTDVHVIKPISPGIDSEAVRVVKLLPKFAPGKREGKAVKVYFNLPVRFVLKAPEGSEKKLIEQKIQTDVYYKGADLLVKQGRYADATKLAVLSTLISPNDYLGYELLGDCDSAMRREDDANTSYAKAKEVGSPINHKYVHNMVNPFERYDTLNHVYTFVEQNPKFPGGDAKLMEFLAKNIKYPQYERDHNISGRVLSRFVVDVDGSATDVNVVKSPSPGLAKEAVRIVKMLPKFQPGYSNGKAVKVYFNLPVVFRLQDSNNEVQSPEEQKIQNNEFYQNAIILIRTGKYRDAASMLGVSIGKFPLEFLNYEFQALCYLKLGKTQDACADFQKAKELGSPYAVSVLDRICK